VEGALNLSHNKIIYTFRKLLNIWVEPNMEITVAVCLPYPCEYIFSIKNQSINNVEFLEGNSAAHNVNMRNNHRLCKTTCTLYFLFIFFQNSAYCADIKTFSSVQISFKSMINEKDYF
jgi:hypothetical protein